MICWHSLRSFTFHFCWLDFLCDWWTCHFLLVAPHSQPHFGRLTGWEATLLVSWCPRPGSSQGLLGWRQTQNTRGIGKKTQQWCGLAWFWGFLISYCHFNGNNLETLWIGGYPILSHGVLQRLRQVFPPTALVLLSLILLLFAAAKTMHKGQSPDGSSRFDGQVLAEMTCADLLRIFLCQSFLLTFPFLLGDWVVYNYFWDGLTCCHLIWLTLWLFTNRTAQGGRVSFNIGNL